MNRRDIYERMRRNGEYHAADEYRESCERHGHHMGESVRSWDSSDVRDGCGYSSHAGDMAERAARDIRTSERMERERKEEERQEEEREERRAYERETEEEYEQ